MQEKTKKWFMSLTVRTVVSVVIFAVAFLLNSFFPQIMAPVRNMWAKSIDIQKIGTLFCEIGKEFLP